MGFAVPPPPPSFKEWKAHRYFEADDEVYTVSDETVIDDVTASDEVFGPAGEVFDLGD